MNGLHDEVTTRIRDNCSAILQVETGMSAEAAVEMLALGPDVTALVTPLSGRGSPVRGIGLHVSQERTRRFGVTFVLVFPGGFPQFETAFNEVLAALCGWSPTGASTPVQYVADRVLQYAAGQDGGRWMHLIEFTVTEQASYEHQS